MNHFSNDLHEFWPHNAPVDLWSFDAGAATAPGAQGRGLPPDWFFLQRYNAAWRLPHLFLNKNISKWFTWKKHMDTLKHRGFFIIFSMTTILRYPDIPTNPTGCLVGSRSSCLGVYSRWDRMFSEVVWWDYLDCLVHFQVFVCFKTWDFETLT